MKRLTILALSSIIATGICQAQNQANDLILMEMKPVEGYMRTMEVKPEDVYGRTIVETKPLKDELRFRGISQEIKQYLEKVKEILKNDPTVQKLRDLLEEAKKQLPPPLLKELNFAIRDIVHNVKTLSNETIANLKSELKKFNTAVMVTMNQNKADLTKFARNVTDQISDEIDKVQAQGKKIYPFIQGGGKTLEQLVQETSMTVDKLLKDLKITNADLYRKLQEHLISQPIAMNSK